MDRYTQIYHHIVDLSILYLPLVRPQSTHRGDLETLAMEDGPTLWIDFKCMNHRATQGQTNCDKVASQLYLQKVAQLLLVPPDPAVGSPDSRQPSPQPQEPDAPRLRSQTRGSKQKLPS